MLMVSFMKFMYVVSEYITVILYFSLVNPVIVSPSSGTIYTINEGEDFTISCEARAIPAADISFDVSVNGAVSRFIPSSLSAETTDGFARELLSSNRSFTLTDAEDDDSGNYTCIASNITPETDEILIELIVQGM